MLRADDKKKRINFSIKIATIQPFPGRDSKAVGHYSTTYEVQRKNLIVRHGDVEMRRGKNVGPGRRKIVSRTAFRIPRHPSNRYWIQP